MSQAHQQDNQQPSGDDSQNKDNQQQQSSEVDLAKLPADQLNKVLENPDLWKQPRIAELLEAQKKLKEVTSKQEQEQEKQLEEQKRFEELAQKRAEENEQLKSRIKEMQVSQALTSKLVPEGIVDIEAALKLADTGSLEISDDGKVKGVDEVISSLKENKAYLFNNKSSGGSGNPTNPANEGGSSGPAKFKRSQLSDRKFYEEHREDILTAQKAGLIENDLA
jgi:hypothetical protein